MSKLIVIEAGDGSGKATQTKLLFERLNADEKFAGKTHKISFPDYTSDSSALIKMYLSGKFGHDPADVNPYAASLFYAVDRYASFKMNREIFCEEDGIVLADRYTTSNMAHQSAKIADSAERDIFLQWLWDLEFVKIGLPVPDLVIFLDMPPRLSAELIAQRGNKKDIHEKDANFLEKSYAAYNMLCEKYCWQRISCAKGNIIRSPQEIHEAVYAAVTRIL